MQEFPKGKIVRDRYVIEDLLGQGGFGAVYRVRDRRVKGNVFALKEVESLEWRQRENFLFEGEVLRRLDHPALPRVYRVFEKPEHDRICILMDYVAGPNLEQLRSEQPGKRFELHQVMQMMAPIASAISYLHNQQPPIIHRDIKPSNIIIPTSGESAVLVDFGIAKEYNQDATTTAIRHCSPGYGAPEQYVSGTETRTDIYGFGATLYTLLSGAIPIDALYRITRLSVNRADPLVPIGEIVPDIPPDFAAAIHRSLAINSSDRFATVNDFWQALEATVQQPETLSDQPANPVPVQEAEAQPALVPAILPASGRLEHSSAVSTASDPGRHNDFIETEDLPVSSEPTEADVHLPSPQPPRRRRKTGLIILIIALLLLLGGGGGAMAWFNLIPRPGHAPSTTTQHTPVAQKTVAPTATPTSTATPVPTSVPTHAPTQPPANFPTIASAYNGSIHNTPASVDSTMSLTGMRQQQGTIHGHLALGPGLQGDGDFTGQVTRDKKIQFLVSSYAGHLPLFFQGQIQGDGSISGSYCSYQNNQCNNGNGGYGSWQVRPNVSSSGSLVPSTTSGQATLASGRPEAEIWTGFRCLAKL
ncbi:serine/threonine protein kinase [Dictyobacter formicarum]|uniref:non-specific serine/threonine protein kinase n=1 Tax=Dictyobacter formicarum TaxID=2778368 RepID=A0ABQ3VK75_9CHLR|nr:serine/threonine-protein kinase [Dictyobacter formicarum]GHO86218.1 hypothetical protein KSZ_42240 [Dictyobacter formicarum]